MLRKKIKELVKVDLQNNAGFEIIHDAGAMEIIGGTSTCAKLDSCQNYTGDCPNLTKCGTYAS